MRSLKWKAQRVGKAAKLRFNATEPRFNAAVLRSMQQSCRWRDTAVVLIFRVRIWEKWCRLTSNGQHQWDAAGESQCCSRSISDMIDSACKGTTLFW